MVEKVRSQRRRLLVWLVSLPVTVGLACWAYYVHGDASDTRMQLEAVQEKAKVTAGDLKEWQQLKAEVDQAESDLGVMRRKLKSTLGSFSRKELHKAFRESFVDLDLETMVLVQDRAGNYRAAHWIWSPEDGQSVACRLFAEDWPSELQRQLPVEDILIPLQAKTVKLIAFEVEGDRRSKNATISIKADDEVLFELKVPYDPNSTSHSGSYGEQFPKLRVIGQSWFWQDTYKDRIERGAWLPFDKLEVGLRAKSNPKANSRIGCQFDLISNKPIFTEPYHRRLLEDRGVNVREVSDKDSEYFGLFEIIGLAISDSLPISEQLGGAE